MMAHCRAANIDQEIAVFGPEVMKHRYRSNIFFDITCSSSTPHSSLPGRSLRWIFGNYFSIKIFEDIVLEVGTLILICWSSSCQSVLSRHLFRSHFVGQPFSPLLLLPSKAELDSIRWFEDHIGGHMSLGGGFEKSLLCTFSAQPWIGCLRLALALPTPPTLRTTLHRIALPWNYPILLL